MKDLGDRKDGYHYAQDKYKVYRWRTGSNQMDRESRSCIDKENNIWTEDWKKDPPLMFFNVGEMEDLEVVVAEEKIDPPTKKEALEMFDRLLTGGDPRKDQDFLRNEVLNTLEE